MADIRIKDLVRTVTVPKLVEYVETDHAADGSGKLDIASFVAAHAHSRSVRPSLYSDGSTASRRVEFTPGAAGAVAGMPISIPFEFDVPPSNPSETMRLWEIGPDATPNNSNALSLQLNTAGTLLVQEIGAAANYSRLTNYVGFRAAYSGQRVRGMVVFGADIIETTTPPTMYINGVDVAASMTQTTGGTPPNWGHAALNTTLLMMGYTASAIRFVPHGLILGALTAAEVLSWTQTGQLPTWCAVQSGSAVPLFDTPTTGWSATRATIVGNQDGVSDGTTAKDDCILFYANADENSHGGYNEYSVLNGGYYEFEADYYIPADQTNVAQIVLTQTSGGSLAVVSGSVTGSTVGEWSTVSGVVKVVTAAGAIAISLRTAAGASIYVGANDPGDDSVYISRIQVRPLGPIFTPVAQPGGVVLADSGSNRIPGLLTAGITAIGERPEHIIVLSGQMTADGFVLADQVMTPTGYELVAAYATRIAGAGTGTLTVKETSSGGTTVATAAVAAGTVALTVSNGMFASGKKLHVANSSWDSTTVQLRFVFRRFQ